MKKLLALSVAVISIFSACQVNYEKTKTGLKYKIFKGDGKGAEVKPNSFIKFNVEYRFQRNDSVLTTTFGKVPAYSPVDTTERSAYSFMEVITKTKVGDSIVVVMSVDSLKNKGLIQAYDNMFHQGDNIIGKIKVLQVFPDDKAMVADYQKEQDKARMAEVGVLEEYIKKNNINAVKTKNGVFVEMQQQGTGAKADTGKQVSVMYQGYLLDAKKTVIDSNTDPKFNHTEPYILVVGAMQAIPGWDDALPYFNAGGKGRIYIPASMAYGAQGRPPAIPGNSNLGFDIEVKEVKDAPKQDPTQQMPPQQ
jgi:FKBP-type peptidyl-prolyl cis-trans isomerase FkpA